MVRPNSHDGKEWFAENTRRDVCVFTVTRSRTTFNIGDLYFGLRGSQGSRYTGS